MTTNNSPNDLSHQSFAPPSGTTALEVNSFVATGQQQSAFEIGLNVAQGLPNDDIARAANTVQSVRQAAAAVQQGSAIGVGIALAGAVPGSDFAKTMGQVNALSNAANAVRQGSLFGAGMALTNLDPNSKFSQVMGRASLISNVANAARQGNYLNAGMSLAGLDPNSGFAQVMGDISQGIGIIKQGMAILNPQIDPKTLINYIQPPSAATPKKSPSSSGGAIGGQDGAYIKGEGIRPNACPNAGKDKQVGAPVQALYGSKILSGGDDIDYSGNSYLPMVMSRMYNSQNPDIGWFGQGWTTQGYEQRLELDPQHNRIYLIDNSGRRVPFTYLAPGQSCYQPSERITLYRKPLSEDKQHTTASSRPILADAVSGARIGAHEPLEFIIYRGQYRPTTGQPETDILAADKPIDNFEGLAQHYSYVAKRDKRGTSATVLLSNYGDKYGHQIQLHYTRDSQSGIAHIPQYLTEDAGACYELELTTINKQTRLSSLYLIDSTQRQDNPDSIKRVTLASYQYSKDGDLIEVKQQERITRTFAYQNHLMIAQSKPSGQQAVYRYDQYDDAKTARVVEHGINNGKHFLFDYDIDSDGIKSTTVTEQSGTDFERSRRFEFDDWYNMTSSTDYLGNTTRFDIDDNNRTTKITQPNGSQTLYNYQGSHLNSVQMQVGISEITKLPLYRELSYQYNHQGKVTAITDALGNTQRFSYNARGELESQTDALGNTTTFSYDKHGNIINQTLANGSDYRFEYDAHGNMITQTDCSGYQTHYAYDDKRRLRQIIDAMGQVTEHHYSYSKAHLEHLLTQVSYPDGTHIQMDYDEQGRLIKYTDAKGQVVEYDYDANGQPTRRAESKESEAINEKEIASVKRLNESGQALTYSYDVLGRLTRLTNENGEQWTFDYDANDNLTCESRFDGYQSQYEYNSLGQLTHQIDNADLDRQHQRHIYNQYNLAGEITERYSSHYPDIITHSHSQAQKSDNPEHNRVRYEYDIAGRLMAVTNPDSRVELDYDPVGRLTTETLISHLTGQYDAREHSLTHEYDALGNRIKTILPDGKQLKQAYYGSGHLYNQSLYNPKTDNLIELRHSERNKVHQEISRQQGALMSSYGYDAMGRLVKQYSSTERHTPVERHYHYDTLGQLTHLTGNSVIDGTQNSQHNTRYQRGHQYEYDKQGRLIEHKLTDYAQQSGMTEVFAFDPASNRVPVTVQANHSDGKDNNDNASTAMVNTGRPTELISNGQRIRYTYDSHGRMMYKIKESVDNPDKHIRTALYLQYNADNEVSNSITREYHRDKIKQTCTRYHYDAFGRRIAKHSEIRQLVLEPNDNNDNPFKQLSKTEYQHTHMLWDGDRLIQEYSDTHVYTTVYDQGSFTPIARAVWLKEGMTLAANDDDGYADDNDAYAKQKSSQSNIQVFYYHNDQLGTPNELTNDKGEIVWLADYEAWGNTAKVVWNETKLEPLQVDKAYLQPIRFQGQSFDEETGLHYNRFRYYDPDMGMFISRDPIGLMGGDNVFAYAPNPTGWVDPLGLIDHSANPTTNESISNMSLSKVLMLVLRGMRGVIGIALEPSKTSPCSDFSCTDARRIARIAAQAHNASAVTEQNRDNYRLVFRGTNRHNEIDFHSDTGFIMSDATQIAYRESFYNLETALLAGAARDAQLLAIYGSPHAMAMAQSTQGTEFENAPRSRFSVTTNLSTAIQYANGGNVYASWVPKDNLFYAPINNTTGGEQEYFIPVAYPMAKVNPNRTKEDMQHSD